MADLPKILRDFFGRGDANAPTPRSAPTAPPKGTVVLKPKNAPRPQGREILLTPKGETLPGSPTGPRVAIPPHVKQVTPAAIVYALAAGILFALALYNLLHGSIFNGLVTMLPAGGLAVLAYKYIQ